MFLVHDVILNIPHEYINQQHNCIYHADALVGWFESGDGHQVWRTVHSKYAHVLQPMPTPRRQENISNATKRKRARSTGPANPIWNRVADSVIFLSYLVSHQSSILTENVIFWVRSKDTFDGL